MQYEQRQRPVASLEHEQPGIASFHQSAAHRTILTLAVARGWDSAVDVH
jgi:hypothetical protein